MYYFEYKVKYFNNDGYEEKMYGITVANTYPEAITNIVDFYGKNNIISIKLEELDTDSCIEMSKECLRQLREDNIY